MSYAVAKPSLRSALCVIVFLCTAFPGNGEIIIQGSPPAGVSVRFALSEYYRVFNRLAPNKRPDKSPLTIIYFTKSSAAGMSAALPEWGGGGAIGDSLIIIPIDFKPFLEQSFPQITVHELVHIVLARAYPDVAIPRWFHEGTAMLLAGELSFEENTIVSKAIFLGRLMPLSSIDSVNSFPRGRADLAYSQSHLAVLFLVDQYGIAALPELLRVTQRTKSFKAGLLQTTGLSLPEFEELVGKYIASKYRFVFLITDTYMWWVAIAVLFIAGFIATAIRNRKRAAAMEEAERLEAVKNNQIQMLDDQTALTQNKEVFPPLKVLPPDERKEKE